MCNLVTQHVYIYKNNHNNKSHISRDARYHVQAGPPRELADPGLHFIQAPYDVITFKQPG